MKLYIYDTEVFLFDWIAVFKDMDTGEYTVIHNDGELLRDFLMEEPIVCGFNTKGYDRFIVTAIACGASNEEVKELNDFIIAGGNGWEYPMMRQWYFPFHNIDIMDDMQKGLSLKAIEGHLGMNIRESEVDFRLDRPLTEAELAETIAYCKADVDATEQIVRLRKDYLETKLRIGRMVGLPDEKSLGLTNAKLTAALLRAEKKPHRDERAYVLPGNLELRYIPPEVLQYFDRMKDERIDDKELVGKKLKLMIGECPITLGFGGIHGAIPNFLWKEEGGRIIRNYDVGSYYPHLMTVNGYTSRNIPSPKVYSDVLEARMKAKAAGDKATANALKLICNTTYGATLNQYNDLYDPLMARSVCISGQLYLLELAEHLFAEVEGLRVVQLNTDGIMVEMEEGRLSQAHDIAEEWQRRTGFTLEEDRISAIYQKDVNGYIEVQEDGSVKAKGGYLVRGIAKAGAFNVNNNMTIVSRAIIDWFTKGTPPEQTIVECNDPLAFQLIAKAGSKYREAYHLVDGEPRPVQKVNRVYATSDERYGRLVKVKASDDSEAMIESLPEHCLIDNENKISIESIDKSWYIELAKKRINDFHGIKPEKKKGRKTMSEAKKDNVYKRLGWVRQKFMEHGVQKNGKNMTLKAKYFQLDDIVPVALPLFNEAELLPVVNFDKNLCTMVIYDMNDPNQNIIFSSEVREWNGNAAVTPVQAMGATITYMRRYLYQLALDIVQCDEIENSAVPTMTRNPDGAAPVTPVQLSVMAEGGSTQKAPITPSQRNDVKVALTAPDGMADELQIKGLKNALRELLKVHPEENAFAAELATKTEGFTKLTKEQCEKLIIGISKKLEQSHEQ